jgi:hypothetical protein
MKAVLIASLLALALSAAGSNAAPPAKPIAQPRPSPAITALFKPDMLGANRAFVDRKTGPAKYVEANVRTYVIDGCKVSIRYAKDSVRNLTLDGLSDRCTFDLAPFFPSTKLGAASRLTFGAFKAAFVTARYLPQCMGTCGNAADPAMSAYYSGSHAEQFYEIEISNSYPYRGPQARAAIDVVMDAASTFSADPSYQADCDPSTAQRAKGAFTNVQVKTITIGYDLDANPARCKRP